MRRPPRAGCVRTGFGLRVERRPTAKAVTRTVCVACALSLSAPVVALAQQARPSRLAIETVAAIDESSDGDGTGATGICVDAIVSVSLGRGFEGIVWPVVQRLASSGRWNQDVWIATVRYERAGRIGVRIEGGLLPSPIGLANLTVRRPHLNPTISQPSSLFTPLPSLEDGGPSDFAERTLAVLLLL